MAELLAEASRATADVGALVTFRLAEVRRNSRRRLRLGAGLLLAMTIGCIVVPAFLAGAVTSQRATEMARLLPSAYVAFLCITTLATILARGGRELLARDDALAFPVSPTTDHLGALVYAPLNFAWMVQAWSLLALTAYAAGPANLWAVQLTTLAWLFFATTFAQAAAWSVEGVRRTRHGEWTVRACGAVLALAATALVVGNHVSTVLPRGGLLPELGRIALDGREHSLRWAVGTVVISAGGVLAVVLGAAFAHLAARRPPKEEVRAEGQVATPRPTALTDLAALVRIDRSSVWRSLPLRHGFIFLALMPAFGAAAGQLRWEMLPIIPGLVAAGAALLFGVNAWSLDGVGTLWRDSLPVSPTQAFDARARVLGEVLLVAPILTLVVAMLRHQALPTTSEATALLATGVVVPLQVLARSMHWSARRPFATALRSARGAPAPPMTMVGYSAYLSLTSTLTGLVFSATAQSASPWLPVVVAVPFLLLATRRLRITRREWSSPVPRAKVIATVSAR